MSRRLISSGSTFEDTIGYSRAVVEGDWVFVAGCTGQVWQVFISRLTTCSYDYSTGLISESVVEQCRQTLVNIQTALEQADTSFKDIVRVRYILPDKKDFSPCWPVIREWFGEVRPACTMIEAGLFADEMKIEIEVTAKKSN
ncbi:2-iminobutanoate/2-iminopropanoate deaminase, partial [Tremellales sp. Uapishka_1]